MTFIYLLAGLVVFFVTIVTFYSGFGLTTVLMPTCALFMPVEASIVLTAFIHILSNIARVALLWKHVDLGITVRFGLPAVLSAVPGALLLHYLADASVGYTYTFFGLTATVTPVKLVIGSILLLIAFFESSNKNHVLHASYMAVPGGILSGFFGGLSGHQGAFRNAFLVGICSNKMQLLATSALIALCVDVARLIVYGIHFDQLLQKTSGWLIFVASLATIFGVIVARQKLKMISYKHVRMIVVLFLYVIAIGLLSGLL